MATFDEQIRQVGQYLAGLQAQGRAVRRFDAPASPDELRQGLPIRVGPGANPRILLRSETHVELGSPDAGSSAFVLWTNDMSLVESGRITLVGPDIPEAADASLPFGQVLIVAGADLTTEDHPALGQAEIVADQIEGYMVRSSSRSLWSRVSKDVAARGFSFETLGRSLMSLFKSSVPKVQAVEVLFVTSAREDVTRLNEIAEPVQQMASVMLKEHFKAKGYDLDCDLHCGSCKDKSVCDDIRKVVAASERKRQDEQSAADRPSSPGERV